MPEGLNLSVTADAVPPPLTRGGLGIPQSFASSPEAPLPGELSAKQTERLDEGKPVREALTERFNSVLLYLRNQFRVNLFQIEFEQFGDAVLLHGDAVEDIGGLHGAAAVGDDDELGLVAHPAQILREADDIGVIQRGLNLVQQTERRRF